MIETVFGLLLVLAGAGVGFGLTSSFIPVPIGIGGALIVASIGLVLAAHGVFRQRLKREGTDTHWWRTCGLAVTILVLLAIAGFVVPAFVPLLNAFKIAGFPLGYYVTAVGVLIGFVMILFWHAARSERIDSLEKQAE